VREASRYLRPVGLSGIEAVHARFVRHSYRPHSHPTWTVAVVEAGAARFSLDATRQQARAGEIFVLEPEAVHTGTAAVPEGWAYKVLYVPPDVLREWAQAAGAPPGAARWVVFRDPILWARLLCAHAALAGEPLGLGVDVPVAEAVAALRPHLCAGVSATRRLRAEHPAVARAIAHLRERWNRRVLLSELADVARLSRFELVRRFHNQVGLPPHAFQTDLRISRARRLLLAGTPPAEVAFCCGFADQAHFTRSFRASVGVPPARFARA